MAQTISDTVFCVPDVVVTASRNQHFGNDIKTDMFSKKDMESYAGESLGRFLSEKTALNIKAYGAGGALSNMALRGTSTSHVQVNWNGFPINSVTVGSYDFSMIPAGGFSQVSVIYGASGALYGSGTFGGAVNLDNDLSPVKACNGLAHLEYQSLNAVFGNLSYNWGNKWAAYSINAWGALSGNKFTYYDYIMQHKRTQTDGNWHDAGIIQNVAFKLTPKSTFEVGLWYQIKAYHIPSRIGSTSNEFQKDSCFRLYSAYKVHGNRWGLQVKAARFSDRENYWQKASSQSTVKSIESTIASVQCYGDADFRYFIRPYLSADVGFTGSSIVADVSAYGKTKREEGIALIAGVKYDKDRLSIQSAVRKEFNSNFTSGLLPSAGVAWKALPGIWVVRANISQKFRKPTFNDLYWIPGGNAGLRPEKGYSIETGSLITLLNKDRISLSADESFYSARIEDMIVWRPSGTYWSAENYQKVRTSGMESKLLFNARFPEMEYHSSLMVTLNRSLYKPNSGDEEKVMLYAPRVITAWENSLQSGIWTFSVWHHFTADRYYDDNALLSPYQTVDVQLKARIPAGKKIWSANVTVFNVTNATYELIRLFPMPGRYWSVKMSYTF